MSKSSFSSTGLLWRWELYVWLGMWLKEVWHCVDVRYIEVIYARPCVKLSFLFRACYRFSEKIY